MFSTSVVPMSMVLQLLLELWNRIVLLNKLLTSTINFFSLLSFVVFYSRVLHFSLCFLCRYHAIHKEVYDWFDISFDQFGRTSSPEQTEICQSIFQKIFDNKWISEITMEQVFNSPIYFIGYCCRCSSLLFS